MTIPAGPIHAPFSVDPRELSDETLEHDIEYWTGLKEKTEEQTNWSSTLLQEQIARLNELTHEHETDKLKIGFLFAIGLGIWAISRTPGLRGR